MGRLSLSLLLVGVLNGGAVRFWSSDELASAPVLAVVHVEAASQGPPKAGFVPHAQYDIRTCNARLKILRSFPVLKTGVVNLSYSCNGPLGLRGNMPAYPWLARGKTYLVPFRSVGKALGLLGDRGVRLIIPALERAPIRSARTRREFLAAEIAGPFLHTSFHQAYLAGHDLGFDRCPAFAGDLIEQLANALPASSPRWLDIATALAANPYLKPEDIQEATSQGRTAQAALAAQVFRRISGPDQRRLLALNVVSRAYLLGSSAGKGLSATMLQEILQFLPGDLTELRPGAVYIGWRLAGSGEHTLLTPSLSAAEKILNSPDSSHFDFDGAANLLFGYGGEEQLALYLRALRAAKTSDPPRYWALWRPALLRNSARVLKAAAVLIDDERPANQESSYRGMRYCDIAVIRLQEVTGRQFGLVPGDQRAEGRDRAVRQARDWLHENMN